MARGYDDSLAASGYSEEQYDEIEAYLSDDNEEDMIAASEKANDGGVRANFQKVIVVDGIPLAPESKKAKLEGLLNKVFGQFGTIQENGLAIPFALTRSMNKKTGVEEDRNMSCGFAFVAFEKAESASKAVSLADGFKLDNKHTFRVCMYTDLDKYRNWADKYTEPEMPAFKPPLAFKSWLTDPDVRDQYVIRQGNETKVMWNEGMVVNTTEENQVAYDGARQRAKGRSWCEMYVAWSPLGTYLATFHRQGIVLWGGPEFTEVSRYAARGVQHMIFSPRERYIVTWNGVDNNKDKEALIIWDVSTGKKMRSFAVAPGAQWPILTWSHDDKYFSRGTKDGICVFETPSMKMMEKKPIRASGMKDYRWSPGNNYISYWAPEVDQKPARVVLLDPVRRVEVRSKNLYNVSDVKLHWQEKGDFLCAQVLRHTKSKKTTFSNLEIFRMRDANFPNEIIEFKDKLIHFSFAPKGCRFGVIHGNNELRNKVSFYDLGAVKGGSKVKNMYTEDDKQANMIKWSPNGNSVILAGLSDISGKLEFWDVEERMSTNTTEHFMCNDIQWDPSGRIVATVVTQPMFEAVAMRYTLENGFKLWTFQGMPIRDEPRNKFYQVSYFLIIFTRHSSRNAPANNRRMVYPNAMA